MLSQLKTKKPKLRSDLVDIQAQVSKLSDQFEGLSNCSINIAKDGVHLSDEMINLCEYVLSSDGRGNADGIRKRLEDIVNMHNTLIRHARNLQEQFPLLDESLESFRDYLEKKVREWKKENEKSPVQKFFDGLSVLLKALGIALFAVGVIVGIVATGPAAVPVVAGLVTAGVVSGFMVDTIQCFIDLKNEGMWSKHLLSE
jgi:hypothetical protein